MMFNRFFFSAIKYFIFSNHFSDKKILFRTACLINTPINNFNNGYFQNFQKMRIDVLYKIRKNELSPPRFFNIWLFKPFLYTVFIQQMKSFWTNVKEKDILIMDSYSELTDQLFIKNKNAFLGHYNDIDSKFKLKGFSCCGLLNEKEIEKYYILFFNELFTVNPNLKVYFFTYPTVKEERVKYINRSRIIRDVIKSLAVRYKIIFYDLDDYEYEIKNEEESFPYHYNSEFYEYLSEELKKILNS